MEDFNNYSNIEPKNASEQDFEDENKENKTEKIIEEKLEEEKIEQRNEKPIENQIDLEAIKHLWQTVTLLFEKTIK